MTARKHRKRSERDADADTLDALAFVTERPSRGEILENALRELRCEMADVKRKLTLNA
jgi:hypothetical protein